jgi:hypothetical protein
MCIGDIRPNVVDAVRIVCGEMFEKFDFMKFGDPIYADIVHRFSEGVVT